MIAPMRKFIRPTLAMLTIGCLASVLALASTGAALAQTRQQPAAAQAAPSAQQPQTRQIALTDKQIEGVLAAKQDFDAIADKLPSGQKGMARLDAVAKKHGFANYAEHEAVIDNIRLVRAGFDPATKKYAGAEAVIKARIARTQADKKMSADDKKEALAELNEELKSPPPAVTIKANIDLVERYYDKLAKALNDDDD